MTRRLLAIAALALGFFIEARAGEVARGELPILGTGLEVDRNPVSAATGVPSFVQTIFGGRMNDDAPSAPGLSVLGDLTGPGIDAPITLSAIPGKRFSIPALHRKGEYTLQNIRLAGASGEFLQPAVPPFAIVNVADALQTRVRVRQLTPDELRERGILIDDRNYEAYEFTFIFGVDESAVEIPYPVLIDKYSRTIEPIGPQGQAPPPLPKNGPRQRFVAPPPKIFDIGTIGELPPARENDREPRISPPRLPAALVVPSGFGVLHQFFAVILEVSNVSEDATVRLDGVSASLRAPLQMRVSKVVPAVAVGQAVPVRDETTGATFLVAGARGTAEWTLEAMKAGTHTIDLEVRATYQKPGQEDFPMYGTASASIVVSDPRFQVNFSHPDVVRKDEPYTAYAFVTNLSEQRQHVVLDTSAIPPCTSGGALENICRTEGDGSVTLDIEAGEMLPVPYKLRSTVTGKVFAAAGAANDEAIGVSVQLTMGVSASGIPLSPATLLLPYYAQYLPSSFVDANLQLLGLGYSLATAPLNKFTARQPRVITTDVFTRAQEIARAGQRVFVAGDERDAMIHLSLDLLDNVERAEDLARNPLLEEWDQLRRQEEAGRRAAAAMARELERTASATFVDDFATAAAHRSPFLFAYVHGAAVAGESRPYALSLAGLTTHARLDVPAEAASGWIRELATSELTRLDLTDAGELALVGRWTENVRITVTPKSAAFTLHLLYPDVDGTLLRADIPFAGATPNVPVHVELQRGARALPGIVSAVALPPIRILGAAQDLHLDESGHVVSLLFNRPAAIPENEKWRDQLALTIDVAKASYSATRRNTPTDVQIPAAIPQSDGRMLNVTFAKTLSTNAAYSIRLEGAFGLDVVPRIENDRPGAILTGRVLLPDNTPAAQAFVSLTLPDARGALLQGDGTGADGRFLFEFVPRDPDRGLFGQYELRAQTVDAKVTEVAGAVRLPGEVHTVNLVFAGRGRVRGQVRYDDGTPIPNRLVSASSPLHNGEFTDVTDANGYYEMEVGVGPLTFAFIDPDGRITFVTNQLRTAGEVVTQDLVVLRAAPAGSGTINLNVRRADTNAPLASALVAVSVNGYVFPGGWTDANGAYVFRDVPAGVVTILAEHGDVSAGIEVDLRADQTLEQTIVLDIRNTVVEYATLEGVVTRDDPAAPNDATKDQLVPNAVIAIGRAATVTASADGTYRFTELPASLSGAVITVYDPATSRQGWFRVPTLLPGVVNRLPLRLSTTTTGTATMRVRLYDAQNAPVSGFKVLSPGYPPVTFAEKSAGVYENADVRVPLSEAVVAIASGTSHSYGDQFASGSVRVDFDGQVGVTDLRLPGAGTLAVRIEAGGAPALGRVSVTYFYWDVFSQGLQPKTIELDPDPTTGVVTFPKIPARQWITVATVRHPLGHAEERVYLTHDGDVRQVTLRLQSAGDVTGRVFAHDGITPLPNATVRIVTGTASYSAQLSKPDGSFRFPALPANVAFEVIAELAQDGVFRTGMAYGRTPEGGGPVANVRVTMRERSDVEGRVVDANGNAAPLARYWLRELTWPHRSIGTAQDPLQADIHGRFAVGNVFTGPFRISAVSADNQELRGDYQGTLLEEGDASQKNVEVRIGAAGTGAISVTVLDPLLGFEPVENAEVALLRDGQRFDFTSTNENGVAYFESVPAGTYVVTAFSKVRVRGGTSAAFAVVANETASVSVQLEFRGLVAGYMTDPDSQPLPGARVPAMPVTIRGPGYEMRDSTDGGGAFELVGVPEGEFQLFGYEIGTERIAAGPAGLFISRLAPEHRDIHLQLERFAKLTVKVYLPNDAGGPGELVPLASVDVCQCNPIWGDYQYMRAFQGNPVTFERMIHRRGYSVSVQELGGEGRAISVGGAFPPNVYDHEQIVVLPATGPLEVLVRDGAGNPVADAAVHIITQGRVFDVYSDANGLVTLSGIAFGWASATATKGSVTASGSGSVASRTQPLRIVLNLGTNISVSGLVEAETPANTPSASTRVVLNVTSRLLAGTLRLETLTGNDGAYSFAGIPAGGTSLELLYYGADDTTIGAVRSMAIADGTTGNVAIAPVRLDATPPRVLAIDPPASSTNVAPTTSVTVTFSEQFQASYLDTSTFQLRSSADGSLVAATIQSSVRPDGTFVVKLIPQPAQPFPLASNVLYRFTIASGIRDLTGNAMQTPVGTSFTTVDYAEPAIVRVEPSESEALVEGQTFRVKFNKAVSLASFDTGNGGVAFLDRLDAYKGTVVETIPVTRHLDPADPSMLVIAPNGVAIAESSFYRLTIGGVRDTSEPPNVQRDTRVFDFFSFDRVKPVIAIVSPVAEGESLIAGVLYTATIDSGGATDVAYVDWLDASGVSIGRSRATPFGYNFVAPSNVASFTLKAGATDLSFNTSDVVAKTWNVAPNEAPKSVVVTHVPSSAYPGQAIETRVAFSDEGLAVTVALELRGTHTDGTPIQQVLASQKVTRASTGVAFADALFHYTLPLTLKDGTATIVATATDAVNKSGTGEAALTILADTAAPRITSFLPLAESRYRYGVNGSYTIAVQASDAETGVARAVFAVDGVEVFNGPAPFTHTVSVPPKNADTRVAVVVTVYDHRGNTASETHEVIYERVDDATLPVAAWLTPLDGAALPSNQAGWLTTLRVRATDDVKVTQVRFESTALAAPITLTAPASGDVFETKAALTMTAGTPFVIKAIVSDGDPAHDVELPIAIHPVAAAPVINADINISSLTADQYANKSVLVRGARVFVTVPLAVTDLMLVDGATLSNPEGARLELTIANRFFVDGDSRVDLTEKGLAAGPPDADASHGGLGGSAYGATNATYGSIDAPTDFGTGHGGGAMQLTGGTFALAGPLRADGRGGATAGSGGSIDLRANAIVTSPLTRITANGGDAPSSDEVDRGGGGGRIAIRAQRLDVDASAPVIQARGGRNGAALEGSQYVDGGAGTIYVNGSLTVSSFDERHPASTHRTAGTPIAGTFDAIAIGPRALARFDAAPGVTPTVDATAFVAMPSDVPSVTLTAAGGDVRQHTAIGATWTAASGSGIREVRTILDVQPAASTPVILSAAKDLEIPGARIARPFAVSAAQGDDVVMYPRFATNVTDAATSIVVPSTATPGPASLKVRVTDRAGRVVESAPVAFNVIANAPPVIETFVAPSESHAGRALEITATATDDVAVTALTLASSIGSVTAQSPGRFTLAIPPATPGGTDVVLTLVASDGFPGRAATTATHTIRILADGNAPSLTVVTPIANAHVQEGSGQTFVVEVSASDAEVAVQRVTATLDGAEHALAFVSGTTWRATLNVPNVDGTEPVAKTLVVAAYDYSANVASESVAIHVDPLIDPNAPALQWVCASPGAMAPPGYELTLRVSAVPSGGANGVASVTTSVNGGAAAAMASAGTNLYETKFTIPPGTPDGTLFDVRIVARSVGGNESTLLGGIRAIAGTEIATSSFIDAGDTAFENQSIIVRAGGVLTVSGTHHLRNLAVLSGGSLIQQHADLSRADRLSAERIFFECGATSDMTGRGYARNASAPGLAVADYHSAGSHIGRGAVASRASGAAFGSITQPREAGGGGHLRDDGAPGNSGAGGGALRLHANASFAIDGTLKANGAGTNRVGWGGGAGGSVWISTGGHLAGGGSIEAVGGTTSQARTGGGGGAVALEYASASGPLLASVLAHGGSTGWGAHGGAGSIFTRNAASTHGELTIDNKGLAGATELPSFGRATVSAVDGMTATLQGIRWLPRALEGHHVRAGAGTHRIVTVTNDAALRFVDGFFDVRTQDAVAYDGYLVHSPEGIGGRTFVAARFTTRWEYDDGTTFTPFNPRAGDAVIASFRKNASSITALSTFTCNGTCPAIHDMPSLELASGEIVPNAVGGIDNTAVMDAGLIDDAEFFLRNVILGNGTDARITLDGAVTAGSVLQGVHRFDALTLKSATVITDDLVEAATTSIDASSSLAAGNATTPLLDLTSATIERGLHGAVLVGASGATSDPEGPADVVARNVTRGSATPRVTWNYNQYMFSGTRGGLSLARRPGDRGAPYGISTLESITTRGYVSFTPSQRNQELQAGLAPADTTRADDEPGIFAFKLRTDGRYEIWSHGTYVPGHDGTYFTTTLFRIERTPGALRYVVDGAIMYEVTASLPPSLLFDVAVATSQSAELHSIEYDTTSEHGFRSRVAAETNGSFRIPLRGEHGDVVHVSARDRHRLPLTSSELAVTIPNDVGVAGIALEPSQVVGGRSVTGTVTLLAPAGNEGARVELTSNHGAATVPPSMRIAPNAISGTFTITTSAVAAALDVTIGATYGGIGTAALLRVTPDSIAPSIAITSPVANSEYTEGQAAKIDVVATVTDPDSGVSRVRATLDATTVDMTRAGDVFTAQLAVPFVDGTANVTKEIVVTAEDNNGNSGSRSVPVVIKPIVDAQQPTIAFACGSDGAMFPVNASARLRVIARAPSANNALQSVALTITDPNGVATTVTPSLVAADTYEHVLAIPDAADGGTIVVHAVATTVSGTSASADSTLRIVKGAVEFTSSATIADATHDNKSIVIHEGVTVTMSGAHVFDRLVVLGTLTHPAGASLELTAGALFTGCRGAIDATARGYATSATYPGAQPVTRVQEGGSHLGRGGAGVASATYGSIHQPRESGAGDIRNHRGGGAIRITAAQSVVVDGAIRANGGGNGGGEGAGAGGSVWIAAARVGGAGAIEADGGNGCWAGGGGAIAIDHSATGTPALHARPGTTQCGFAGGPGTVFVRGAASTLGDVRVDTAGRGAAGIVELPSLGGGIAQSGTTGATLVTDRAADIPAYFAGHSVRTSRGTSRIVAIANRSVTLADDLGLAPGDTWQGVYRFDTLALRDAELVSLDRVEATQTIVDGSVTATAIRGGSLDVNAAATLTHPAGAALDVELTGALTVASTATIDATARGYDRNATYPGARNVTKVQEAGSHIGRGGAVTLSGATYGSVFAPRESGAGDIRNHSGGGAIRIRAASATIHGAIRANGGGNGGGEGAGAGGSVWLDATTLAGSGTIEANGGSGCWAGGGGAVAVEYDDGNVPLLLARAGASQCGNYGGAGSVVVNASATFDNSTRGLGTAELPALGTGIAQSGTTGATLVTAAAIPLYFAGHSVEIANKGTWRIASVNGATLTLAPNANETIALAPGDAWRGVYAFGTLTLRSTRLLSGDRVTYASLDKDAASTLDFNAAAPQFSGTPEVRNTFSGTFVAGTVIDTDAPVRLTATNARTAQTFTASANANGTFSVAVSGIDGDTFTIVATDSHAMPLSTPVVTATGAYADPNVVDSIVVPAAVTSGTTVYGTIRLAYPAASSLSVLLASSDASVASVPASVTIAAGTSSAQFAIATSATGTATITATYRQTRSASIAVTQASSALAALAIDTPSLEGGASANGTVSLGAPAPAGGAVVSLASSDTSRAVVPASVVIAEGATSATFTIATSRVAASSIVTISGTWGATRTADLTLTACSTMGVASPVAAPSMTTWLDDALPAGAIATGAASFDATQAASGTQSLHFAAATGAREWSFTGASPLAVGAGDEIVLHALVNPCNPPRQIAVTFGGGVTVSGNWGESLIEPGTRTQIGAISAGGTWTRLTLRAPSAGNLTALTIKVHGGEAWLDLAGARACSVARAARPQRHASEVTWFDDALPAGANTTWTWDASQAAIGDSAHYVTPRAGAHQSDFTGATDRMSVAPGDVLFAWVLLDPCNPPREVMLQFHDGSGFEHRAYWGDDLIPYGTHSTRTRIGPLPRATGWVRLEVPASLVALDNRTVSGVALTLYDGAAWLDAVGRIPRVNVARAKTATQSSTYSDGTGAFDASRAVDGLTRGDYPAGLITHTLTQWQPWWQVDLGQPQSIDAIQLWNRTDCCGGRLSNFWVFVSDAPIAAATVDGARAEAGVRAFHFPGGADASTYLRIASRGRYVRVQISANDVLSLAEVQVWAPIESARQNLAAGVVAVSQSTTHAGDVTSFGAQRAVDGTTRGDYPIGGITHSTSDAQPWWQVDLGSVQAIATIDLWNRLDCCGERLTNAWVFVSDAPFAATTVDATLAQAGVSAYNVGAQPAPSLEIARTGRYVRVQLPATNYLSLAEVQVWSHDRILAGLSKVTPDE